MKKTEKICFENEKMSEILKKSGKISKKSNFFHFFTPFKNQIQTFSKIPRLFPNAFLPILAVFRRISV